MTQERPSQQEQARFWDDQFDNPDGPTEWLVGFDELQPVLMSLDLLNKQSWLLPGCGTSRFGAQLDASDALVRSICSVDISAVAIEQLSDLHKNQDNMSWIAGDCTQLPQLLPGTSKPCVVTVVCKRARNESHSD